MEIAITLHTDSHNSDPTAKLQITPGNNGKVYLKLTDFDREVSVSIKDLRVAISAAGDCMDD